MTTRFAPPVREIRTTGGLTVTSASFSQDGVVTLGADIAPSGADVSASYIVLNLTGSLPNERVLTAGSGIALIDGGAGSTLTIAATGGGTGAQPLWLLPTSSHADDVEYETTAQPSGWLLRDIDDSVTLNLTSSAPDPYTNPVTHGALYAAHTNWRISFAALQIRADDHDVIWAKPLTETTNYLVWTRAGRATVPGGGGQSMLCLLKDDGSGVPDFNNGLFVGHRAAGSPDFSFFVKHAGIITESGNFGSTAPTGAAAWPYYALQRVGTATYGHVFDDNGSIVSFAPLSFTDVVAWVGYYIRSHSTSPGAPVYRFDFLRRVDSAQGMPT
jgi:hypothetical protein